MTTGPAADEVIARTEHWFLQRGIPHFIADYSASRDVLTRAAPVFAFVFLGEVIVNAPNQSFPIWLDVIAVVGAFAAAIGLWALLNRVRGRPPRARPTSVGPIEMIVFVLGPAAIPALLGAQWRSAVVTALVNLGLLGGVYLGTSYGVVPTLRWAAARLVRQLEGIIGLLVRSLPLLALLVTFLFLTAEVWQTAGVLYGRAYWIALALFALVGIVFVVVRLPRELGELASFASWDEVRGLVVSSPVATAVDGVQPRAAPPLSRRQWGNVGLVALFSQGLQIVLVSAMIGAFFVTLGLLTVSEPTTKLWAGHVHVVATWTLDRRDLVITEELLRVAGFLTAFAGLNFTVYLLTDATYRAEFREEVVAEIREAFAVRAVYHAMLAAGDVPGRSSPPTD